MMEATQDRVVVLAVVIMLGAAGIVGLVAAAFLVHDGADASSVAVITTLAGTAIGGLAGLLASTRTAQPALAQAEASGQVTGFAKAVSQVNDLAAAMPVPTPTTVYQTFASPDPAPSQVAPTPIPPGPGFPVNPAPPADGGPVETAPPADGGGI